MNETLEKVICANCGWASKRKTGQVVICPDCNSVAGFDVPVDWAKFKYQPKKIQVKIMSDNSWLKSIDGLPPVGVLCEWSRNGTSWEPCEIIHYYMNTVLIDHVIHRGNVRLFKLDDMKFRPMKTDRDIAIDLLVEEIFGYYANPKAAESYIGIASYLYDAGYRKQIQIN